MEVNRRNMLKDVRRIDGIKLYYPFLRSKTSNQKRPLDRGDLRRMKVYLLFVDKIVIPPHDIFNYQFAIQNSKFFLLPELQEFPIEETFVFTSTKDWISEVKELIDLYIEVDQAQGGQALKGLFQSINNLPTFYRDESFQREQYAIFIKENKEKLPSEIRKDVIGIVEQKPRHEELIRELPIGEIAPNVREKVFGLLMTAYHFAGKEGNNAVVPPTGYLDLPPAYNPMYAYDVVSILNKVIIEKLGLGSIDLLTLKKVKELSQFLSLFKKKYFSISQAYDEAFIKVDKLVPLLTEFTHNYFGYRKKLQRFIYSTLFEQLYEIIVNILSTVVKVAKPIDFLLAMLSEKLDVKETISRSFEFLSLKVKYRHLDPPFKEIILELHKAYELLENSLETIIDNIYLLQ